VRAAQGVDQWQDGSRTKSFQRFGRLGAVRLPRRSSRCARRRAGEFRHSA
jgi:hypothetical protein